MITEQTFFTATCDVCGESYKENGEVTVHSDKDTMTALIEEHGWRVDGQKCYCPKCQEG